MRRFRLVLVFLAAILLIQSYPLFAHSSRDGIILGRYTLPYFGLLIGYSAFVVLIVGMAIKPSSKVYDAIIPPIRWLQKYPVVHFLLAVGLLQAWYAIKDSHLITRYIGFPGEAPYRLTLLAAGLIGLWLLGVLLFLGKDAKHTQETVFGLVIFAISLCVSFLLFAQGYTRILQKWAYLRQSSVYRTVIADEDLGWRTRPNLDKAEFYFAAEDRFVEVSTNDQGFRSIPSDDKAVIAGIGDSFLFGMWIDDADLWNVKLAEITGLPVANYSLHGYGLSQYNTLAELYAIHSDPDVVVYGIYVNDLVIWDTPEADARHWGFYIWTASTRTGYTFRHFFVDSSPVEQTLKLLTRTPASGPSASYHGMRCSLAFALANLYDPSTMNPRIARQLDRAIDLADQGGYTAVFTLIPTKERVYADTLSTVCAEDSLNAALNTEKGYHFISDYLDERGMKSYDMTLNFQTAAAVSPEPLYFDTDDHWNKYGQQVYAELLADYLYAEHLIPPR